MNATISDEIFSTAMDKAMKAINLPKKERIKRIEAFLLLNPKERDGMLDAAENMARVAQRKEVIPREKSEQIEFVAWFKKTYPDVVIMMIRNDGTRSFAERPEQLLMGLHPGAADLFIPAWHLWVEMKRIKGWVQSDVQKQFEKDMNACGYAYLLCNGFESAKEQIEAYAKI